MIQKEHSGIQVIARATSILRILKDNRTGLSLGQIAKKVELPRSTVQRIVATLATERLVLIDTKGGGIRLGPELGAFAEAANFNIVERCRSILHEVTQETGETTDLAVFRDGMMVFLDQVPGLHRLRTVSAVGEVFPLTTTANGRACLALMDEEVARNHIENEWSRAGSTGEISELLTILAQIKRTGFAYDRDEHTDGISAIGFGFRDWSNNWHAISVPVPSSRFQTARASIEASLLNAKKRVEDTFASVEN